MALTLRFQSTGTVPGSAGPVTMRGASLTIGRGPENELVLPDPDRMISKRHCVIEDHGARFVVIDLSTNGTFLNYSKTPVGTQAIPINGGDVLTLGTYELVVDISDGKEGPDAFAPPPGATPSQTGHWPDATDPLEDPADFLDDLLGAPGEVSGPRQIIPEDPLDIAPPLPDDEDPILGPAPEGPSFDSRPDHRPSAQDAFPVARAHGSFIPDDWDLETGGGASPATPTIPEIPAAEPAPQPPEPVPPAPATTSAEIASDDAARAFLAAAGVEHLQITPSDLTATMARLGGVVRTLVTGMREILMTRTAIKSEFRMAQTMVRAGDNNPLKFSVSPEQAMEAMVRPATRGYLDPATAAAEALRDVKAHEIAMMSGMEAALKGILKRLDPKALESRIEGQGELSNLFKGKKARYWEVYEKMYAEISDQAENDFHDLFSREFARAYEEQIRKL